MHQLWFQYQQVQLKDIIIYNEGDERLIVSIPTGAIEGIIICGLIKNHCLVSIPTGAIEGNSSLVWRWAGLQFQYQQVQLKANGIVTLIWLAALVSIPTGAIEGQGCSW